MWDTRNTREVPQWNSKNYKSAGKEEKIGNQLDIMKQEESQKIEERNKSAGFLDVGIHETAHPRTMDQLPHKGDKSTANYCAMPYSTDSKRSDRRENPKRARKSLALEVKMDVLRRYEAGQITTEIHHALNLSRSTCCTIRSNTGKIKASQMALSHLSIKPGDCIKVKGKVAPHAKRFVLVLYSDMSAFGQALRLIHFFSGFELLDVVPPFASFALNLGRDGSNLILHFNPRFESLGDVRTIVCNSKESGEWGSELRESIFPFEYGEQTKVTVKIDEGHEIKIPNRLGFESAEYFAVEGDISIRSVKFE
ncbi:hypothetical protein JD844_013528 [Phrynosoma platyrhinos]|uniref:Galectin n=1 Tax=Phrynosoma platyrhinos TaxID=52577 RepID=A0ABQ7TM48_PHRPL|nr:hypothetical protein JD844_013528 [Phrynosoma platyrhinos]